MNCDNCRVLIMKYFDNDMESGENAVLHHHMRECEACRNEFEHMKQIFMLAEENADIEPPESFEKEVMNAIRGLKPYGVSLKPYISMAVYVLLASIIMYFALSVQKIFSTDPSQAFNNARNLLSEASAFLTVFAASATVVYSVLLDFFVLILSGLYVIANLGLSFIKDYYYYFIVLLTIFIASQRLFFSLIKERTQ